MQSPFSLSRQPVSQPIQPGGEEAAEAACVWMGMAVVKGNCVFKGIWVITGTSVRTGTCVVTGTSVTLGVVAAPAVAVAAADCVGVGEGEGVDADNQHGDDGQSFDLHGTTSLGAAWYRHVPTVFLPNSSFFIFEPGT